MERRILDGEYQGVCEVPLEGKPYMAVFARKIRATPLPEKSDPDCLLRDLRHYPGGKISTDCLQKRPFWAAIPLSCMIPFAICRPWQGTL